MTNARPVALSSVAGLVLTAEITVSSLPLAVAAQEPPAEGHVVASAVAVAEQEHAGAQEHGDPHAVVEHAGPSWRVYAFRWINFVLLAILLYWVLVVAPPFVRENFEFDGLRDVLGSRSQQVTDTRDLARQQQASAESRLTESALRLERVEQEAAALLTDAGESAERDKERLIAAASGEAEAIGATASRDLDTQVARSRRALQAHVADQAISIAKKILQDNFSADDQRRLVREHLDSLGETVA